MQKKKKVSMANENLQQSSDTICYACKNFNADILVQKHKNKIIYI